MATPIFNAIGVAGKCVESICITKLTSDREAPVINRQLRDRNDHAHDDDTHDEHYSIASTQMLLFNHAFVIITILVALLEWQ
jgi:hypothetical protein